VLLIKGVIMQTLTVEMIYTKSTKRTHVYSSTDSNDPIPTLYIKRDRLPKEAPKQITITVSADI